MVGTQQQGLLRYEERVRLERANGLREDDLCADNGCGCSSSDEGYMTGMTYAELAQTPLKQNAVCPHTKVIVPITPAFTVNESVKDIVVNYASTPYRVVDRNPCDGRTGMLNAIPHSSDVEVQHASTTVTYSTKVEDTLFDTPNEVKTVTHTVLTEGNVQQPVAVNGTEPDDSVTDNGKTKKRKNSSEATE